MPLITEKTVRLLQEENKITFLVERNASKSAIKKEFEEKYKVKVIKVGTYNTLTRKKKAYITLAPDVDGMSLGVKLGYF